MAFPKNRTELKGMIGLMKAIRFVSPALRLLGVKLEGKELDHAVTLAENVLMLAERFNPTFAPRGWIVCSVLNTEAAQAALDAAAAGRWEDADVLLAESYSPMIVRAFLRRMGNQRCFKNRLELALLAVDDYEAGRFHACVPVTLALLDGMGQELTGANFFRNTRRIKPKESFLEIGPGVAQLLQVMSETRNTTTTDPIRIPFRHGILHGTDLGYNSKIVAAKAFAALLAVGDYAAQFLAPPPAPKPGLMESLRRSAEADRWLEEVVNSARAWSPRTPQELAGIVARQEFAPGTPEETVAVMLKAWKERKFGILSMHSCDALKTDVNLLAGRIRRALGPGPDRVQVVSVEDMSPAGSSVKASLRWGDETDEIALNLVYYKGNNFAPRNVQGGTWLASSLWPLESARSSVVDEPEGDNAA
jgi:hypothetical protein